MSELMVETDALTKRFGALAALNLVDLRVPRGSVLGLLGHNGAGKTTLVRILSTALPPTSGSAKVGGYDVVRDARRVRRVIGLTGQYAAVDEQLTAVGNLVLIARLLGASRAQARRRAHELLEVFDLTSSANRLCRTFSGGMRRRLDLAASLVGTPDLIFLDEPTTGLDPVSRSALWDVIRARIDDGATALLTTQYLEEADRLADSIAVLSDGAIVAAGTVAQLKAEVGATTIHLAIADADEARQVAERLRESGRPAVLDGESEVVTPVDESSDLVGVLQALSGLPVRVTAVRLAEPTLDDVYLSFTGSGPAVPVHS
jgi:ABC-2 type transport system ATP-binding protein